MHILSFFYLWWKDNLVKRQKVSKYYEIDCHENFLLLFMFLLTVPIAKNCYIWVEMHFIFLKSMLKQTWRSFNTNFWPEQFLFKTVSKALELPKLSKKTSLEGSEASWKDDIVFRNNHSQNISDKLSFSCEITRYIYIYIYIYIQYTYETLEFKVNLLYVINMSHRRFRVNLHFIIAWMSRNFVLKTGGMGYLKFRWQQQDELSEFESRCCHSK